jgi:hypothetical protein
MREPWLLLSMAALGAYHGANPGMGWLFAVSVGLQERSRRSVVRALPVIAAGHELSIVVVAVIVSLLGLLADAAALRLGAAAALIAFGVFRFARPRWHPRWTRMRVRGRELALWSFLMSSAHGAGLMVAPLLIAGGVGGEAEADVHGVAPAGAAHLPLADTALLVTVHVAAMLAVMSVIALLVYGRFSTRLVRRIWPNLDGVWAGAFVVTGAFALVTA